MQSFDQFDRRVGVPLSSGESDSWEDLPHTVEVPAYPPRANGSQLGRMPPAQMTEVASFDLRTARPAYAELPKLKPGSKAERLRRKGATKRAALLDGPALERVETQIRLNSRSVASDLLKLRLSVRAGLRASEIADLPIEAMITANRSIQDHIVVRTSKTRGNPSKRTVIMHDEIRQALASLLEQHPDASHAAFSIGKDGALRRQSAASVANWFYRLYRAAGLLGCSSHSGRRTFATELARNLGAYNSSVKDLQDVLGHSCLSSTECYLEPSAGLADAIRSLGA